MTELFNIPETLSPRLAWMKQHNLSVESGTNLDDGDRFFEVRQGNKVILEDPSEDRAIVRAAKKLNLNLWNEDGLAR